MDCGMCCVLFGPMLVVIVCVPLFIGMAFNDIDSTSSFTIPVGTIALVVGAFLAMLAIMCMIGSYATAQKDHSHQMFDLIRKKHERTTFFNKGVTLVMSPHSAYICLRIAVPLQQLFGQPPYGYGPTPFGYGPTPFGY